MPKSKLTALKVKSIKELGRYHDSEGLYLEVSQGGGKSWLYRYSFNGRRRLMGLGSCKDLTLEQARAARDDQRKLLRKGLDPIENKKIIVQERKRSTLDIESEEAKERSISFEECANSFIAQKKSEWKNEKHIQQWGNTLRDYVYPHIGKLRVQDIDVHLVLKCLTPIWTTKNETASRVRQRIESILSYAKVMGYRSGENPAAWKDNLAYILPKPSKVKKVRHHKALAYDEMPSFYAKLVNMNGLAALALRLTILTSSRTSEVLKATLDEFDPEKRIWTIPKERMKAGIEHRVALSDTSIEVLNLMTSYVEQAAIKGNLLCPGKKRGRPLCNISMNQVLKRMGYNNITVHGFRSTFRDWIAEKTSFPSRVAETALAHQLKDNAEKAYQRGDLLEKRFELMGAWASFCTKG